MKASAIFLRVLSPSIGRSAAEGGGERAGGKWERKWLWNKGGVGLTPIFHLRKVGWNGVYIMDKWSGSIVLGALITAPQYGLSL